MKKKHTYIAVLLILLVNFAFAQIDYYKGVPNLNNFNPENFQHNGKIWDIDSDKNGMIYMASDKGLIEFDGEIWKVFKGSRGFTRSLLIVSESEIYTGSDLDFGVWKKNEYQDFEYLSLYPFKEETLDVSEEFWQVHRLDDKIIFVSSQNLYVYKDEKLTKIAAPYRFTGSFSIDELLYFADETNGLYILKDLSLIKVFENPEISNFEIEGVFHHDNNIIIVTRSLGLYIFSEGNLSRINNELSQKLQIANVFSFEKIGDSFLVFGTILKGVYISDLQGNIIHHISKNKGLPNNTALCLHYSTNGKLWIGMDYGISTLDLADNASYLYDFSGDFGTANTALLKDDIFYVGTNQGLYYIDWDDLNNNNDFFNYNLIKNSEGQVWDLQNIDNTILVGHDKGLFSLENNSLRKISEQQGVWTIIQYQNYLFAGYYNGILIFEKKDNTWSFVRKMELISGSCNQLITENDNILWINIPNYGIIRAFINEKLAPQDRLFFDINSFEGNNPILIKENDKVSVKTNKFLYLFNPKTNKFDSKTGIAEQIKIKNRVSPIYKSIMLNSDYRFCPIYDGFALYSTNKHEDISVEYQLLLREILAFNNDGKVSYFQNSEIPYRLNNLKVVCIVANQDNVEYRYKFEDTDNWSNWSSNNVFEFFRLKHGEYRLLVEAKVNNQITETLEISFEIKSPWYFSWYSYILYSLLLLILLYILNLRQKASLKKQKQKLLIKQQNELQLQAEKHKLEIMALHQNTMQIEFDQMKQQLKSKTIELASKAKDNEVKNRLLTTLKEKCETIRKNPSVTQMRMREMQKLLDSHLVIDDKIFETQMDELHQDYFKVLKERFPSLTNNDLRMCAYLKIGLSSKETASMLDILPSSFYISRSRLRKKLNLKADEDLCNFLSSIKS